MSSISEFEAATEVAAVAEAPAKVKAKPGPKPKPRAVVGLPHPSSQSGQYAAAPEPARIILPSVPKALEGMKLVPGTRVIQIGVEGLSNLQTLGEFETPNDFDKEFLAPAYGAEEAGTVGAFRSVAELCQPQRHSAIGMVHPGWTVWTNGAGKKHQIKRGSGTLTLLCSYKADNKAINDAYGRLSNRQVISVDQSIANSNLILPPGVREKHAQEDADAAGVLAEIDALERQLAG